MDSAIYSIPAYLREGHVSSYNPKTKTARVRFEELDNLVSHPFKVIVPNSIDNKDEYHLDVGEHVTCLCLGNGIEAGYVVGSTYDAKNPPTVGNQDRRVTIFKDGAFEFYDRKDHIYQFKDHYGSYILFKDGDIILQSHRHIHLNPHDIPAEPLVKDTYLDAIFG